MTTTPRAATATFPYPHATVAETCPWATRRAAVLTIITDHIGKVLPTARTMSVQLDCTTGQIGHVVRQMVKDGLVEVIGYGNTRFVRVIGVGETIPRFEGKEVAAYVPPEPEPLRVESFSCALCGTRNCTQHGASFVTTGRPGGWQLAAGRR